MDKIKNNIKYIIPAVITIFIIILCNLYSNLDNSSDNNSITVKEDAKDKEKVKNEYFYVDIKGAINNPGVYKLTKNSRVIDVINLAGGLIKDADTSLINLSKKITDEMLIVVYTKTEIEKYKNNEINSNEKIKEKLENSKITIDKNNNAEIKENNKSNKTEKSKENTIININTATKDMFINLPGIGESKANSIIKYRDKNGNFNSIEEIKNVSGIGDSLFEKIKNYLKV